MITTPHTVVIPTDHPTEVDVAAINARLDRTDPGSAGTDRQYLGHGPSGPVWRGERVFDVRHYGAVSGAESSRDAFIAADAAAAAVSGTVFVPAGTWNLPLGFSPSSNVTYAGTGRGSYIVFTGASGALFDMQNKMFIRFVDLRVSISGANTTAFYVSNSFKGSWTRVNVTGSNQPGTPAATTQRGIWLTNNAGDNRITDCDLDSLGEAIRTECIQNYVVGCAFSANRRGIVGGDATGAAFVAGISVANTTFVGYGTISDVHVLCEGTAAEWWFSQVWFEKAAVAVRIGTPTLGPRSFSLEHAVVSGITTCLDLQGARQAHLADITFGNEAGTATPVELTINAGGCGQGFAASLRSVALYDFADSVFPPGWFVYRRGAARLPEAVGMYGGTATGRGAANPNTSGATLASLEAEVNEIKQFLRDTNQNAP